MSVVKDAIKKVSSVLRSIRRPKETSVSTSLTCQWDCEPRSAVDVLKSSGDSHGNGGSSDTGKRVDGPMLTSLLSSLPAQKTTSESSQKSRGFTGEPGIPLTYQWVDELAQFDQDQLEYLVEKSRFQNARPVGRGGTEMSARTAGMGHVSERWFESDDSIATRRNYHDK